MRRSVAGHNRINRFNREFADNEISLEGATSLSCWDDHSRALKASGWSASRIDGPGSGRSQPRSSRRDRSDRPH